MKFLSSTVILSALALSWVMAEDPMPSVGAEGLRQASLPTAKSIRRRTDAPVVEKPRPIVPPPRAASQAMYQQPKQQQANKTEQQRGAGVPKFEDNDYMKRLTTEMEDFERDWAARRGAKVPPKQHQQVKTGGAVPPPAQAQKPRQATAQGNQPQQPLFNEDMLKAAQNMAKNVDMDALLNQPGLKDMIAPIAESVKGGNAEDIKQGVRAFSQQLAQNPERVQGMMDKIMDTFAPPTDQPAVAADGQKRQATIADLLKDFTAPSAAAGADGSKKAPGLDGLDDLFGSLFGGSPNANKADGAAGKKQTGGWEDLFGDLFNTPPPTTANAGQKRNPYGAGQKHPYGYDSSYSHGNKPKYGSHQQYKNKYSSFTDETDWSTGEL